MAQITPSPKKHPRGRTEDGGPNPTDAHVGARMRLRRTLLGLSQERLGNLIGLTFQQVQKYERGANRISASRLYDLSRALDVPVSFFYDDIPANVAAMSPAVILSGHALSLPTSSERDPFASRENMELIRSYMAIPDERVRRHIFHLLRSMAQQEPDAQAEAAE